MTSKLIAFVVLASSIAAQSGGPFVITENVVATGGGTSGGGAFGLSGTSGQPAGQTSTGGQFVVFGGFWKPQVAPTAAPVSISGRVTTADGNGITNVSITIANSSGSTHRALTGPFGYYRIDGLEAGETYVITVGSKRFTFANNPRVVVLADEITDLNFVAKQ